MVRFEGEYQTMLQAGNDVKIPGEILALQLILASKLTSSMLIPIRANVKWEGDKIYENTKKAIARICRGEESEESEADSGDMDLAELIISDDGEEEECHVDINATEIKTFTAEAEGAAGMDSCCSRTLMGQKWFESYKELAPKWMKDGITGPEKSNVSFTFGNGGKMFSSGRYALPVQIHGHRIKLSVELVVQV